MRSPRWRSSSFCASTSSCRSFCVGGSGSNPERASEQRQAAKKGAAVNRARALTHADNVLPVIEQIRAGGASLRQIAAELNARGINSARGGEWHATTVRNIEKV